MKNLATVSNVTMTKVLESNTLKINKCKSTPELENVVSTLFSEANINTPASNRLIENIKTSRNFTAALSSVYNSMLAGENLEVYTIKSPKKKKED